MSDTITLVITHTVPCPHCGAAATLSYAASTGDRDERQVDNVVYLCPTLCTLPPDEIAALVDRDGRSAAPDERP